MDIKTKEDIYYCQKCLMVIEIEYSWDSFSTAKMIGKPVTKIVR